MSAQLFASPSSDPTRDQVRLRLAFEVPSHRQAVEVGTTLSTMCGTDAAVSSTQPSLPRARSWRVELLTEPLRLDVSVIQRWEGRMLAMEESWPGSRFLGWMTCTEPVAGSQAAERGDGAGRGDGEGPRGQPPSQRDLVAVSMLVCPPSEGRGVVHGHSPRG